MPSSDLRPPKPTADEHAHFMDPEQFIQRYGIENLVCCFSGGKDSLCATHYVMEKLKGVDHLKKFVVWVDTTIMIPPAYPFVQETCDQFGWPLVVLKPRMKFEDFILKKNYPCPTKKRRWCCYHLKLEPIKNFTQNLSKSGLVACVTGLRKLESTKRRSYTEVFFMRSCGYIIYNPLLEWSDDDIESYIKRYDLPMPPWYRLGVKETCMCGAFSTESEMMCVRTHYPKIFQRFVDLESKLKTKGAAFFFNYKPRRARDFLKQKLMEDFKEE